MRERTIIWSEARSRTGCSHERCGTRWNAAGCGASWRRSTNPTRLPNLRGFVAIAEHQLRMADRAGTPLVLLFMRFNEHGGDRDDADRRRRTRRRGLGRADQRDPRRGPARADRRGHVLRAPRGRREGGGGHGPLAAGGGDRGARCEEHPSPADLALGRAARSTTPPIPWASRTCSTPPRPACARTHPRADDLRIPPETIGSSGGSLTDLPRGGRHERIDDDRPEPEHDRALG